MPIPLRGDRAARGTKAYPNLHANDVEDAVPTIHNPSPVGVTGFGPVSDGAKWVAIDIATQAELDAHAALPDIHHDHVTLGTGSDPALVLVDQELVLADVLTPAEHTAIGNSAPHHTAVTVTDTTTIDLTLTGQALSAAVLPAGLNPKDMSSGVAANLQVPTANGVGGIAWATQVGSGSSLNLDGGEPGSNYGGIAPLDAGGI